MCAYTAESNGPMTALYAIFSLGECLSLGGLDPVLKLGTAAEKAGALVSKLGGVGAHAVSAAVSLGTKLKEGLGDFVERITEAANNLLGNIAGIGKLVVEGPSGSLHGTGGYTKHEAVGGAGSSNLRKPRTIWIDGEVYEEIFLPAQEYASTMEALNNMYFSRLQGKPIEDIFIGDYKYTVVINKFDDYIIVDKTKIE